MTSKITDVFSFDISDYNLSSFHQVYPEYTQICKNCVCYIVLGGLYVRSCSTIKLNSALPNLTFWYIKSKMTCGLYKTSVSDSGFNLDKNLLSEFHK